MTENTVYVISGANRGLGLGLTKSLLSRPSTTIVATVRNDEAVASLKADAAAIAAANNTTLHIMKLDSTTAVPPEQILKAFNASTGGIVHHVDVLICNAGFAPPFVPTAEVKAEDLRAAFETNTIAPLMLFQSLWPLLQRSSAASGPKLVMMTSSIGCVTQMEPAPGGSYGPSKAALNYITKSLHEQHAAEGLVAIALHPGWVRTRAGEFVAHQWGFLDAPLVAIDDSVMGMLRIIDEAGRENYSGKLVTQTGEILPW